MSDKLYWLIPLVLFIAQLLFTLNSQSQIRYEELAEGVRNPFWLEQRQIYDGVSSNVGWYGSLLLVYKVFGFSLQTAQYFKLALYFVSIICLALLLKKYTPKPWLPLLVIGLSPTLLFYNTSQTSHGIDLLYFPIVLYLTIQQKVWMNLLGWMLAMWAWMSYPTFIFYLPALAFLNLSYLSNLRGLALSLLAFLTPLGLAFLLIQNRPLLLFDPQISSGIFRGAGGFGLSLDNITNNLAGFLKDLFIGGSSYHFEINQSDFSLIFPLLALAFVFSIIFRLLKYNNYNHYNTYKYYIFLALASLLAVLVLSSLTLDPSGFPGMRRYTPALAAFYALFVLGWGHFNQFEARNTKHETNTNVSNFDIRISNSRFIGISIMSLLLIHHLIVYPINLIHLSDPSPSKEPLWFSLKDTPQKSLDSLVETVQKEDLKLVCLDETGQSFYCRIVESYAAVAANCLWNKLICHTIYGYDYKTNSLIPLNSSLWGTYYFEH